MAKICVARIHFAQVPWMTEWRVAVKLIPEGKFSSHINSNLKIGDELEVMAPSGTFGVSVQPDKVEKLSFFCCRKWYYARISMIKTHLA